MFNDVTALVLLPHLKVQNANAVSGPLTWGFPSPTAFVGFADALQRRFPDDLKEGIAGVGIVCHSFEPQVSQPSGKRTKVFNLTRNPLDKDGNPPAITEEGRTHMEISLVLAIRNYHSPEEGTELAAHLLQAAQEMRIAGGSVLHPERRHYKAQWWPLAGNVEDDDKIFCRLRRRLLPGFALVERDDLLVARLDEMRQERPETHSMEALLDLTRLNFESVLTEVAPDPEESTEETKPDEKKPKVKWQIRRKTGWTVPLPVGYAGLSPLYNPGDVANTRDMSTPFRFVERIYTLGEWVSPHRMETMAQLLWRAETDTVLKEGIYRCVNHYNVFIYKKEFQDEQD